MNGAVSPVAEFAPDAPEEGHKEAIVRQFETRRNAMSIEAAEAALNRGNYQECEQTLRSVLDRDRSHRDARLLLAEVMLLTGRRPEAFTQLEHALREHGDDPRVHYAMALLLDASGRPKEAHEYYVRSVELNPEFAVYASAHEQLSGDEAIAPGEAVAYHSALGGEDWVAAAPSHATRAIASTGNSDQTFSPAVSSLLQEAREALAAGNAESAIAQFRAAMAADPENPHIPIHAATVALERNQPAAAVAVLTPAVEQFPNRAAMHRTLGVAHYRLGDYPSSQVALRQALSLDNTSGLAYLLMGCTLEKLGQPEAARTQWERAAALSPRYRSIRR
ncbi:MAG: tetratricopeptide repeat protein [Patescibacteria group bacterium]|nr:tetratricopeptide repeat protein [Patescibacteria group bacterium]